MLKIRDGVDLKELEKYGYLIGEETINVSFNSYGKVFEVENQLIDVVEINKKTKEIELSRTTKNGFRSIVYDDEKKLCNYIKDLIKADLVEKVDD